MCFDSHKRQSFFVPLVIVFVFFDKLTVNNVSVISHLLSMKIQKADPFQKSRLATLKKQLEDWASNNDISMESHNQFLKDRKKKVVMKTFYGCGVVVPYNKKTKVGYREIPESDGI